MASLIFAILGFVFVLIGLVPLFGWLNWIGIILSIIFLVIGMISGVSAQRKNPINKGVAVIGTILCIILLIISVIQLLLGGDLAFYS